MTDAPSFPRDDADALDGIELPAPGTVRRGTLRFSHPTLADWSWPFTVVRGAADGPRLALISGVHPAEYPAIESNIRYMRQLDPATLRGSVVSLPLIDVPAFLERTPFVCPLDGKNPNRFFPGNANGTFTDVLDDAIFRAVVQPADVLVDLHGGDMVEDLVPFSIYSLSDDDAVNSRSREVGLAFGLPYLVANKPRPGGLGGTSIQAAAAAGIPSIIAEAGGCGLLTEPDTELLYEGIDNVLHYLGMLDGPGVAVSGIVEIERFTWMYAPAEGMWYPAVKVGQRVTEGQPLGRIANLYGDTIAEIASPHNGVALFITSSPAMKNEGIIIAIGG